MMNFYNAQLVHYSNSKQLAIGLGWHLWSWLRGLGYTVITFEVISLSLQRLTGKCLSTRRVRFQRWAIGLGFMLADGLAKAVLLEPVRAQLFANLK